MPVVSGAGPGSPAAPTAAATARRVLLVEPDDAVRASLTARIAEAGLAVEAAATLAEALAAGPAPTAVITEYALPDARGAALMTALRQAFGSAPIIVVSDLLTEEDYAGLLAAGIHDYIPKADAPTRLRPTLDRVLSGPAPRLPAIPRTPGPSDFVREHSRYPTAMPVRVKVDSWDDYVVLYTNDLSRGGLFVRTVDPPPVGSGLKVRLGLPDGGVVEMSGEVVHVVAPGHPQRPAGVGVRFVDWTDEQRQQMATLAERVKAGATVPTAAAARPSTTEYTLNAASDRRNMFSALLADLKEQDYYQMLRIGREATPPEIERAFLALARRWHPLRFALDGDEVAQLATELFITVKQARDVLLDPMRSEVYRLRMAGTTRPTAGAARAEPTAPAGAAAVAIPLARIGRSKAGKPPPAVPQPAPKPFNIDELLSDIELPAPVASTPPPVDIARPARKGAPAPSPAPSSESIELETIPAGVPAQAGPAAPAIEPPAPVSTPVPAPAPAPSVPRDPARAAQELAAGERHLGLWRFELALQAFERGLLREPDNLRLKVLRLVTLGRAAHVDGNTDEAEQRYQEALLLDERCGEAVEGVRIVGEQRRKQRRGLFGKWFKGS